MILEELLSGDRQPTTKNVKKLAAYIQKHCSQFLTESKFPKNVLYRGIKGMPEGRSFVGMPRDDRHPINLTKYPNTANAQKQMDIQEECDTFLHQAGFTALRGNSIFCNSSYSIAAAWGKVFSIFPFDGYNFTYSSKYSGIPAYGYDYPESDVGGDLQAEWFVKTNQFHQDNLLYALEQQKDIWFNGKYVAVPRGLLLELAREMKNANNQ